MKQATRIYVVRTVERTGDFSERLVRVEKAGDPDTPDMLEDAEVA